MTSIQKSTIHDSNLLTALGTQTFMESHGHSGPKADIDSYVARNYTPAFFEDELKDEKNIYHIIYYKEKPAGFSKIILNYPHPGMSSNNVTKLERIYLLKEFYDLKLGSMLFDFNVALSKKHNQTGLWLFVWKENLRAFNFYIKNGFKIIGSHDFKISETHANPNHILFLEY